MPNRISDVRERSIVQSENGEVCIRRISIKGPNEKVHIFDTRSYILYLSYEDMAGPAHTVTES